MISGIVNQTSENRTHVCISMVAKIKQKILTHTHPPIQNGSNFAKYHLWESENENELLVLNFAVAFRFLVVCVVVKNEQICFPLNLRSKTKAMEHTHIHSFYSAQGELQIECEEIHIRTEGQRARNEECELSSLRGANEKVFEAFHF